MKNKDSSSYFKYHDVYNARFKRENFTDCKNTLDLLKVKWNDGNLKDYKVLAKVTAEKSIEKKIREFSPFFKGRTNESYCSQTYRSQVFDTSQELKPSRSNNHVSQSNKGVTMKDIVNPTVIRVNKTRNKSSNTERVMENKKSTPYYDECNSESFIKVDECTRKIKKETSPLRNTSYSFTSSNNDQTSCAKNQSLLRKYKNVPKHYENEYIKQSKLTQEQENQRERAHLSSRSFNYSQAELEKERLQELNSSESFYFHKLFRDPLYESAKTKVNGLYNMKNKSRADSTYKSRVDEYYLNISDSNLRSDCNLTTVRSLKEAYKFDLINQIENKRIKDIKNKINQRKLEDKLIQQDREIGEFNQKVKQERKIQIKEVLQKENSKLIEIKREKRKKENKLKEYEIIKRKKIERLLEEERREVMKRNEKFKRLLNKVIVTQIKQKSS